VDFNFLIWSHLGDNQLRYKHFPTVWKFSHKFSIAPSGETIARIPKSLGDAKMVWTFSITMPSMMGIVACMPAEDEKV